MTLHFKAITDMYTGEAGFKCQEFLQDLKVGIIFFTFHIRVQLFAHQLNHRVFQIKITVTSAMTNRLI